MARHGLALRIYLVTLLPVVAVSLIIGALDVLAVGGRWRLLPLGLLLVFFVTAAILFARSLARPIARLAEAAGALGAGRLDARVGLDRSDELGQLGHAFDEMAERMEQLMRAHKELLANVSHELRTPMARIRVALDIVDLDEAGASSPELKRIATDLKELEQLVNDILMTARLELQAGQAGEASLPMRREPTESRTILDAAVARFRELHPARGLEVAMDEPLPVVVADRVLLRRVVDNLLDNARKYSEATSVVTLRATGGAALVVAVVDQGIGMGPADLEKGFAPFFRSDQSRARQTGGVGLGLTLSRRIVEAHGGTITIESERGRGTTVRFTVPAAQP